MGKNVLEFEPHQALFVPDSEPLIFYKAILGIAQKILLPGGRLYFEINEAMGESLVQLMRLFGYSEIQTVQDFNNKERIIKGRKNV
jgi:release factor glutamine methyltransferase